MELPRPSVDTIKQHIQESLKWHVQELNGGLLTAKATAPSRATRVDWSSLGHYYREFTNLLKTASDKSPVVIYIVSGGRDRVDLFQYLGIKKLPTGSAAIILPESLELVVGETEGSLLPEADDWNKTKARFRFSRLNLTHERLQHELFHLAVSQSGLSLPPWFEEGTAALYESSRIGTNDTITFYPSWRSNDSFFLEANTPHRMPSINNLVTMKMADFEHSGGAAGVVKKSLNQTAAYYLVDFLREKGWLNPLLSSGNESTPFDLSTTGLSIEQLSEAFEAWKKVNRKW